MHFDNTEILVLQFFNCFTMHFDNTEILVLQFFYCFTMHFDNTEILVLQYFFNPVFFNSFHALLHLPPS